MTDRHGKFAPRSEGTTGWQVEKVRGRTLDAFESTQWLAQRREGQTQTAGVRVTGTGVESCRGANLDDLSGVHDRYLVRDLHEEGQVVGDENDRESESLLGR